MNRLLLMIAPSKRETTELVLVPASNRERLSCTIIDHDLIFLAYVRAARLSNAP
jgi:hypothetical protein